MAAVDIGGVDTAGIACVSTGRGDNIDETTNRGEAGEGDGCCSGVAIPDI